VPPDDFDEAYEAVYDDSAAPDPIGLRVTQTTYAGDGHPYVIADFTVENTSDYYLEGIYIGVVADWNVGNYEQNLWDFDDSTNLSYVWDVTGMNENYYGVASIRPYGDTFTISGVSPCAAPGDAALFEGLSGGLTYCNGVPGDVRAILGGGPFDLAPGASRRAVFAFVGGASEVEIIDNAKQAHEWFDCPGPCVANEPLAEDLGIALHVASPNPARGTTTLSFTLAHPQPVRLTILDALGREVVVLVDETRAAGDHRVRWNADDFPAGVYLARLAAGAAAASRPFTLLRCRPSLQLEQRLVHVRVDDDGAVGRAPGRRAVDGLARGEGEQQAVHLAVVVVGDDDLLRALHPGEDHVEADGPAGLGVEGEREGAVEAGRREGDARHALVGLQRRGGQLAGAGEEVGEVLEQLPLHLRDERGGRGLAPHRRMDHPLVADEHHR